MDYNIQKKGKKQLRNYKKDVLDVAYEFAKIAYKEFKPILKGIILFGSASRHKAKPDSDIDILIVLDDVGIDLSKELVESYKIITEQLILKVDKRVHVTTLKFTTFFDNIRIGDPVGLNMLRDGVALVDTGFFDPMQELLISGRIRPTYEAVWSYTNRANETLFNSRWHLHRACEDLYWSVTDSTHAVLMKYGMLPPTPEDMPDMMDKYIVSRGLAKKSHVKTIKFFYDLYKAITKHEIKDIDGAKYEKYYKQAKQHVLDMQKIIKSN
ncbi:MAG: putative nucleotidyltransferase [Candidatus Woesearchaeota archaeon]|jgi:predicted nucleotidyltransferase